MPTVQSRTNLATTSSTSANLGATLIATPCNYFIERCRPYISFTEVQQDPAIPSGSVSYKALQSAFSAPNAAVPIWLGRQAVSVSEYTPLSTRIGLATTYSFSVKVGKAAPVLVEHPSEAAEGIVVILDALKAVLDGIAGVTATVNGNFLEITPSGGDDVVITDVTNLTDSFQTTETASQLFAALNEENEENYYFLTWTDRVEANILAMAAEVEATETSNYPKIYLPMTDDPNTLTPVVDPAIDLLGKLKELGYNRTACSWYESGTTDADGNFTPVDTYFDAYTSAYIGQFPAGSTTWKFVDAVGFKAAVDPTTGKALPTRLQGYISDRNGSWYGIERGVTFNHGGTMASGEWIDTIRFKDWINDQIEVRLQNLLLNQIGSKLSFTKADIDRVLAVIEGVLQDGVTVGGLKGYIPPTAPNTIPFSDQASRILQNIKWTGFLAGAIHFIVVDGILTYSEEL